MLLAEYDYETDIAVQRQESLMIGIKQGIEQGIERGFAEGSYQNKLETARLLKQLGDSIQKITQVTGFDYPPSLKFPHSLDWIFHKKRCIIIV